MTVDLPSFVTQMPIAVATNNFDSKTIGVRQTIDSALDLVVEAGPAAAGVELVTGAVERGVAALAEVGALGPVLLVFPGEGRLGALLEDDALFLVIERIVLHGAISSHDVGAGQAGQHGRPAAERDQAVHVRIEAPQGPQAAGHGLGDRLGADRAAVEVPLDLGGLAIDNRHEVVTLLWNGEPVLVHGADYSILASFFQCTVTSIINHLQNRLLIQHRVVEVHVSLFHRKVDGYAFYTVYFSKCFFDRTGAVGAGHSYDIK